MTPWELLACSALYISACVRLSIAGQHWVAAMLMCYALANVFWVVHIMKG